MNKLGKFFFVPENLGIRGSYNKNYLKIVHTTCIKRSWRTMNELYSFFVFFFEKSFVKIIQPTLQCFSIKGTGWWTNSSFTNSISKQKRNSNEKFKITHKINYLNSDTEFSRIKCI